MKKQKISSEIKVFDSIEELPKSAYDLMQKASEAKSNAYSPYSNFQVGAALQLANKK